MFTRYLSLIVTAACIAGALMATNVWVGYGLVLGACSLTGIGIKEGYHRLEELFAAGNRADAEDAFFKSQIGAVKARTGRDLQNELKIDRNVRNSKQAIRTLH